MKSDEIKEAIEHFEKAVKAASRELGVQESNYIPNGMQFMYKGKTIEIKIEVK